MEMTHHVPQIAPILGGLLGIITILVISIFVAVVYCKIFSKAGYHWAMDLLTFVPIANLVVWLMLAFCEWPIEKEINRLRRSVPNAPPSNFRNI